MKYSISRHTHRQTGGGRLPWLEDTAVRQTGWGTEGVGTQGTVEGRQAGRQGVSRVRPHSLTAHETKSFQNITRPFVCLVFFHRSSL